MCKLVHPYSALYEVSVRRPETLPTRVPHSDIRLPLDSASRRTPLPSANASCYRVRSGLSPPSYRPCRAHTKKAPRLRHFVKRRKTLSYAVPLSFHGFQTVHLGDTGIGLISCPFNGGHPVPNYSQNKCGLLISRVCSKVSSLSSPAVSHQPTAF